MDGLWLTPPLTLKKCSSWLDWDLDTRLHHSACGPGFQAPPAFGPDHVVSEFTLEKGFVTAHDICPLQSYSRTGLQFYRGLLCPDTCAIPALLGRDSDSFCLLEVTPQARNDQGEDFMSVILSSQRVFSLLIQTATCVGWIGAIFTLITISYYPWPLRQSGTVANPAYGRWNSAGYHGLSRLLWGMALAWVTLACGSGRGGRQLKKQTQFLFQCQCMCLFPPLHRSGQWLFVLDTVRAPFQAHVFDLFGSLQHHFHVLLQQERRCWDDAFQSGMSHMTTAELSRISWSAVPCPDSSLHSLVRGLLFSGTGALLSCGGSCPNATKAGHER